MRDPLDRAISAYTVAHPVSMAAEFLYEWQRDNSPALERYRERLSKTNYTSIVQLLIAETTRPKLQKAIKMYTCFNTLEEYAQLLANFTSSYPNDDEHSTADTADDANTTTAYHGWKYHFDHNQCDKVAKSTMTTYHTDHMDGDEPMTHNNWDLREMLFQVYESNRSSL